MQGRPSWAGSRSFRDAFTGADEEWHRLVLLEGPTRPKECKGLFCEAEYQGGQEPKRRRLAAGADLAGSACRIVASLDVVQAATKVGWDWCDVVYELACQLLAPRVCNPAGLKMSERLVDDVCLHGIRDRPVSR